MYTSTKYNVITRSNILINRMQYYFILSNLTKFTQKDGVQMKLIYIYNTAKTVHKDQLRE